MTDIRGRNKARLDHVAHEQVADPLGILTIRLVALLGFRVLGVSQCNEAGLFEDVEDRDPILAGGFHADFRAVVLGKPGRQLPQSLGKRREAGLLVLCAAVHIGDSDTGIDPGLVDVESTAIFAKDFEHRRSRL